ncbi:MAG: hypothetical protein HY924_13850 [Elusimicrobia bacterium]|nr:hypothetical protein [Elusimicrobiota bacterium]
MRKVKGFKLEVKPKEVARLSKKAGVDLASLGVQYAAAEGRPPALTPAGLAVLSKEVAAVSKLLVPAVLFETFPGSSASDPSSKILSPIPGVAFSLVLATLGEDAAAKRRELAAGEPERARLWRVICESALSEAVRFATSIIESEAALENCELSPLNPLSGSEALAAALDRLDCAKIGVSLGDAGLRPEDSAVVTLSWLSKSRGRKPKA